MTKLSVHKREPTSGAVLTAIMFSVHQTKPIFNLGQEFDNSNPYMKFGRNWVIND